MTFKRTRNLGYQWDSLFGVQPLFMSHKTFHQLMFVSHWLGHFMIVLTPKANTQAGVRQVYKTLKHEATLTRLCCYIGCDLAHEKWLTNPKITVLGRAYFCFFARPQCGLTTSSSTRPLGQATICGNSGSCHRFGVWKGKVASQKMKTPRCSVNKGGAFHPGRTCDFGMMSLA